MKRPVESDNLQCSGSVRRADGLRKGARLYERAQITEQKERLTEERQEE